MCVCIEVIRPWNNATIAIWSWAGPNLSAYYWNQIMTGEFTKTSTSIIRTMAGNMWHNRSCSIMYVFITHGICSKNCACMNCSTHRDQTYLLINIQTTKYCFCHELKHQFICVYKYVYKMYIFSSLRRFALNFTIWNMEALRSIICTLHKIRMSIFEPLVNEKKSEYNTAWHLLHMATENMISHCI